jgi:hypothetical protein
MPVFEVVAAVPLVTHAAVGLGANTYQTMTLSTAIAALDTGTGLGILPVITLAATVGIASVLYRRFRR